MAVARIGISGWTYGPWRGAFYPSDLPRARELAFASREVDTIEINGSFHSLQRPTSYARWYSDAPEGFVFSVKAPRYVTHMRRLRDIEVPLANFFASGVLALREKMGPILWQFPANFRFERGRFEAFLDLLPADTSAAAKLAERHDDWLSDRALTHADARRPIRHAIEVRNETFRTDEFFALLRARGIACVVSHSSDAWPMIEEMTADFVYCRLHGEGELYSGSYREKIPEWAARVRAWMRENRDVYLYFDNDKKVEAPVDARRLVAEIAGGTARKAPRAPARTRSPRDARRAK